VITERRNSDESGYSLVEMLVTIIMFTLIVGSITTVVITTMKHQTSLSDRGSALASLRNSLEQVDRDIRSADPLCYASGSEIAMFEQTGNTSTEGIIDYSVQPDPKHPGVKDLVYRRYVTAVGLPPSSIVCTTSVTMPGATSPTVTNYYEPPMPSVTRTVIYGLTGNTSLIFTALQINTTTPPTFSNCITNGVSPAGLSVSTIAALIVNVSQQPASLHTPVTATDCGTFLRNAELPQYN
jgi:type II secretory pathway pseudopilin PulG